MPELPEVEVIRRRIAPHMEGKEILRTVVRKSDLRRPVPAELQTELPGQLIMRVERRGKYLIVRCSEANIILHLGMTGDLSILPASTPPGRHDHLDIVFTDGLCLRFNDSRRFGSVSWTKGNPLRQALLEKLGPEPFTSSFTGHYLFKRSRGRRISVKQFIMDGNVVAGLGNIYANEALFRSGISPEREAQALTEYHYDHLRDAVRKVLDNAIKEGQSAITGSTAGDVKTGYFPLTLFVYGKGGFPCRQCGTTIEKIRQGGRSSFYCPKCQR
jgi:formamidopyrimidine-DNA glycosylase